MLRPGAQKAVNVLVKLNLHAALADGVRGAVGRDLVVRIGERNCIWECERRMAADAEVTAGRPTFTHTGRVWVYSKKGRDLRPG